MEIQPYLFFDGACDEALAFYKDAIGAEVTHLVRFKDHPDPSAGPPGDPEKVMHANMRIAGKDIMASDGRRGGKPEFRGFAISLLTDDEADARRRFAGLEKGGQVQMPLSKTFFSPCFGMVTDRFGVTWMVLAQRKES